jgi:hypothetical protein
MTRSIALATVLATALAGCAQKPADAPPMAAANPAAASTPVTGFVPYCGPIWSVDRQGYVEIPCPAGSNYDGPR